MSGSSECVYCSDTGWKPGEEMVPCAWCERGLANKKKMFGHLAPIPPTTPPQVGPLSEAFRRESARAKVLMQEALVVLAAQKAHDPVERPAHYTAGKVECIDAIEVAVEGLTGKEAFLTGQVLKYMWRWKKKDGLEDLRKARWYLERLIGVGESVPSPYAIQPGKVDEAIEEAARELNIKVPPKKAPS
jgi:hypothetical protein